MKLKVSTSNFYVGNKQTEKDAHFLASKNCDISGVQEGHSGNAQAIKHALRRTHLVWWDTKAKGDKAFAALDVPVIVKRGDIVVIKKWCRLISHRAQVKNIGMPRAATAVRFRKGDKLVTFINTHTNAGVQGKSDKTLHLPTKIKRVAEFIRGMIVLEAMIRNAQRRGDLVVLVGDLNYRPEQGPKGGVWKFSPQALFKRTNLRYRGKGLDYIAFSPAFKPGDLVEIPTSQTGSDHPWLTLELDAR